MSRLTDSLLGLSEETARAPNTYSLARYLGILFVILLGTVYALPNLYPPDFALQIRAEAADSQMSQDIVDRATKALEAGGIHIKGTHVDTKNAVLRVYSSEYQRTGFQGGLQWYRCKTGHRFEAELQTWSGRTIDVPSIFIAGASDWGIYQSPGALQTMQERACTRMRGVHLLPGAGHWVQQEQPEATLAHLLTLLD